MVDGMIAHHLEVLGVARRWRVRVFRVEGIHHADTLDRFLRDTVYDVRRPDAGRFQDRRHDVNHVVKLIADAALVLDPLRPRDRHPLPHAAEV
jgi:hypothetical protein